MNTPVLRFARAQDEGDIQQLLTVSQLPLGGVHEALPGFIVAEHDGEIVGVAGLEMCGPEGLHALLRSVAVAPEWQHKGLGRSLVSRALALAQERGMRELYLLTTTAETYFPAFGFAPVTRDSVPDDVKATAEFQGACPASALVMARTVSAA